MEEEIYKASNEILDELEKNNLMTRNLYDYIKSSLRIYVMNIAKNNLTKKEEKSMRVHGDIVFASLSFLYHQELISFENYKSLRDKMSFIDSHYNYDKDE